MKWLPAWFRLRCENPCVAAPSIAAAASCRSKERSSVLFLDYKPLITAEPTCLWTSAHLNQGSKRYCSLCLYNKGNTPFSSLIYCFLSACFLLLLLSLKSYSWCIYNPLWVALCPKGAKYICEVHRDQTDSNKITCESYSIQTELYSPGQWSTSRLHTT